ncbi:MAG: domain S-box protein [Ramlibacter sp.]|nr:domain S-box protein [Ramlibacter sp.]
MHLYRHLPAVLRLVMRRFPLALWLALALALLSSLPAAAGGVKIGGEGRYPLSDEFSYLVDSSRKLTLDEVLQQPVQARFALLRPSSPGANFGFTSAAIWLRVTLDTAADAPPDWLLELAFPPLDHLELFAPGPTGYVRQEGGDNLPFSSRVIPHRNHVLPLSLQPGKATTVYLRLQSEGSVTAPLTLWQKRSLWERDQTAYFGLSLYFGLLIGLLLYNLLLFVSIRDKVYLLYVLFVGGMALFQAALTGMASQFLWPGQLWWNIYSVPAGAVLTATFGLLFARVFLSSAGRNPLTDKLILLQAAGFVATLGVLAYSFSLATHMLTGLAVTCVATVMVAGVIGMRNGHPGARNFVISWTALLLGVIVLGLHNLGLLPSNALTSNAVVFGSAAEMVLLSFALADRVSVARRFKEQAQTRIAAERALVQALSVSHEQLKTSLEEREVILDNSIVGIAFLTPEGKLRWANPTLLEILGARGREFESIDRFYLSREQARKVARKVVARLKRGQVYEAEMQIRRWDGSRIWVSVSGKGVVLERHMRGTVWVIMDISRRKQLEDDLHSALAAEQHPGFVPTAPADA